MRSIFSSYLCQIWIPPSGRCSWIAAEFTSFDCCSVTCVKVQLHLHPEIVSCIHCLYCAVIWAPVDFLVISNLSANSPLTSDINKALTSNYSHFVRRWSQEEQQFLKLISLYFISFSPTTILFSKSLKSPPLFQICVMQSANIFRIKRYTIQTKCETLTPVVPTDQDQTPSPYCQIARARLHLTQHQPACLRDPFTGISIQTAVVLWGQSEINDSCDPIKGCVISKLNKWQIRGEQVIFFACIFPLWKIPINLEAHACRFMTDETQRKEK